MFDSNAPNLAMAARRMQEEKNQVREQETIKEAKVDKFNDEILNIARSSNSLSKAAIWIALVSLLISIAGIF